MRIVALNPVSLPRGARLITGFTLTKTLGLLWSMIRVAQERRDLAHLDPHLLKDIGLTEADVAAEAARAPWDLPAGR